MEIIDCDGRNSQRSVNDSKINLKTAALRNRSMTIMLGLRPIAAGPQQMFILTDRKLDECIFFLLSKRADLA